MKKLKYINITTRQGIIDAYANKYGLNADERLESLLFESSRNRQLVDDAIEAANKGVDTEQWAQWSDFWYKAILQKLPEPEKLAAEADKPVEEVVEEKEKTTLDYLKTPEDYKQYRDDLDHIILDFDFEKVHKVMEHLEWTWYRWVDEYGEEHNSEVPSVYALRQEAYNLLRMCETTGKGSGTGGFQVTFRLCEPFKGPDDFKHRVDFGLKFVVSECFAEL